MAGQRSWQQFEDEATDGVEEEEVRPAVVATAPKRRHQSLPRPQSPRRSWLDTAIEAPVSALRSVLPQGLRPAAARHGRARRAQSWRRASGARKEEEGGAEASAREVLDMPFVAAARLTPSASSRSSPAAAEAGGGAQFLFGAAGAHGAGGLAAAAAAAAAVEARSAQVSGESGSDSDSITGDRPPGRRVAAPRRAPEAPWSWGLSDEEEDADDVQDAARRGDEQLLPWARPSARGAPRRRSKSSSDGSGGASLAEEPPGSGGRRASLAHEIARMSVHDGGRNARGVLQELSPLPAWAARALDSARERAARQDFAGAIQACLPVLAGPPRAVELLQELCASWEKAVHEQLQAHVNQLEALEERCGTALQAERDKQDVEWRIMKSDSDLRSCMEELRFEKGCSEEWRRQAEEHRQEVLRWRQRAEEHERALAAEWRHRVDMQRQVSALQQQCQFQDGAARENASLKLQLREAAAQQARAAMPDEIARRVAELECGALGRCGSEGRTVVKRKLLVKWHPDKQPSTEHAGLATRVMQELQNRPEWTDAPA